MKLYFSEDVRTTKPSTVIKAKQSSVVEVKSSGIDSPWDDRYNMELGIQCNVKLHFSEDSEDVIATKPSPVIKAKQPSTVKVKSSGINSPWDRYVCIFSYTCSYIIMYVCIPQTILVKKTALRSCLLLHNTMARLLLPQLKYSTFILL